MNETSEELAERQADICRVFANPRRVLILWAVAESEKSVTDIAEAIGASLQNTSQHLHLMKEKGILYSRREAQTIYYGLDQTAIATQCHLLVQAHKKDQPQILW
ncbi:MAG: winged helix-turn-helix transcriptional regulator [Chloroflexi bacterium]|nr:winged helix-turn-helix transcriptional regulator [Chloroflexota bacterium]MBP7042745.1 winged helix-turn-helix transcriptional regulator [Chloroflexota bacterium]